MNDVEKRGWLFANNRIVKNIFFRDGGHAIAFLVEVLFSCYSKNLYPEITIHRGRVIICVEGSQDSVPEESIHIMNIVDEIIDGHGW